MVPEMGPSQELKKVPEGTQCRWEPLQPEKERGVSSPSSLPQTPHALVCPGNPLSPGLPPGFVGFLLAPLPKEARAGPRGIRRMVRWGSVKILDLHGTHNPSLVNPPVFTAFLASVAFHRTPAKVFERLPGTRLEITELPCTCVEQRSQPTRSTQQTQWVGPGAQAGPCTFVLTSLPPSLPRTSAGSVLQVRQQWLLPPPLAHTRP